MRNSISTTVGIVVALASAALALAQDVPYSVGKWAEELGNHRARVRAAEKAPAVLARLEWRRSDPDVEKKDVVVVDAKANKPLANRVVAEINRECGQVVFEPALGAEYFIYFMPCNPGRGAFAHAKYNPPKETAAADWVKANRLTKDGLAAGEWKKLPQATVVEFQARTDFDRVDPMEVIATAAEVRDLLAKHPGKPYLTFPEDRRFPIRMTGDLPAKWIRSGPATAFAGKAQPGEYYVFQVGLYASAGPVNGVSAEFADLRGEQGGKVTVPAGGFTCFNLGGSDWLGQPLKKEVSVPAGSPRRIAPAADKVQALWFGVQIPADATAGVHPQGVTIAAQGAPATKIVLAIEVAGPKLGNCGDGELWRLSRLRWLNSTLAIDDELVAPYTAVTVFATANRAWADRRARSACWAGRSASARRGCSPRRIAPGRTGVDRLDLPRLGGTGPTPRRGRSWPGPWRSWPSWPTDRRRGSRRRANC